MAGEAELDESEGRFEDEATTVEFEAAKNGERAAGTTDGPGRAGAGAGAGGRMTRDDALTSGCAGGKLAFSSLKSSSPSSSLKRFESPRRPDTNRRRLCGAISDDDASRDG